MPNGPPTQAGKVQFSPGLASSFLRGISMTGQSPLTSLYNMMTGPARAISPMLGLWAPPEMGGAEVAEMYGLEPPFTTGEKVAEFVGGAIPGGAGGGSAAWRWLPSRLGRRAPGASGAGGPKQQIMEETQEAIDELGEIARSYEDIAARSDWLLRSPQAAAPRIHARIPEPSWQYFPSRVGWTDLLRGR